MGEWLSNIISYVLESDIALYIAVLCDVVFSVLNSKAVKKLKNQSTEKIIDNDIQALISYHEKVAKQLKEKANKEGN